VDCKMAASVIQNHPHCSNISGALSVLFVTILAIEYDIPWNDEQVATYGESFKAGLRTLKMPWLRYSEQSPTTRSL